MSPPRSPRAPPCLRAFSRRPSPVSLLPRETLTPEMRHADACADIRRHDARAAYAMVIAEACDMPRHVLMMRTAASAADAMLMLYFDITRYHHAISESDKDAIARCVMPDAAQQTPLIMSRSTRQINRQTHFAYDYAQRYVHAAVPRRSPPPPIRAADEILWQAAAARRLMARKSEAAFARKERAAPFSRFFACHHAIIFFFFAFAAR